MKLINNLCFSLSLSWSEGERELNNTNYNKLETSVSLYSHHDDDGSCLHIKIITK